MHRFRAPGTRAGHGLSYLLCALLGAALSAGAAAQKSKPEPAADWVGRYSFSEDGGRTVGGSAILITHELTVKRQGGGLEGHLVSNGYQTSADLICDARPDATRLRLVFRKYGESNLSRPYQSGDLLLTLTRRKRGRRTELRTTWGKFEPAIESGKKLRVAFRREP